jgi:hypothetical protein
MLKLELILILLCQAMYIRLWFAFGVLAVLVQQVTTVMARTQWGALVGAMLKVLLM